MAHSGAKSRPSGASDGWSLFVRGGERKYLTQAERQRVLVAFEALPADQRLFGLTLAWTGARISEVLALTLASFDVEAGVVAIETLKRRRFVVRQVPLPPGLVHDLDARFLLRAPRQETEARAQRLWPFSRTTAWRLVKAAMAEAGLSGRPACPRGLRHAFGVATLQAGVPITLLQRWLGHARLTSSAVYAEISGPEERAIATRYWNSSKGICMKTSLEEALDAVARLRGDPALDAEGWRIILRAIHSSSRPGSARVEDEGAFEESSGGAEGKC